MSPLHALDRTRLAAPTPCGSLWLAVNGTQAALRCSGALWLPEERALIAADLHLEKGSAYAARGQLLPPYDTADTLARLEAEVAALDPRVVILLGDSFHDARALARIAPRDVERLEMLAQGRTWVWAEGNHDLALLSQALSNPPASGSHHTLADTAQTSTRVHAGVQALSNRPESLLAMGLNRARVGLEQASNGPSSDHPLPILGHLSRVASGSGGGRNGSETAPDAGRDEPPPIRAKLPGEVADAVTIATLVLRHEPRPGRQPGEVAGHLHPCVRLASGRAGVRRRAFLTDGERLVLPAFGAYAGGLNVRDPAFTPLFARPPLAAALGDRRVHPLPWDALRGD